MFKGLLNYEFDCLPSGHFWVKINGIWHILKTTLMSALTKLRLIKTACQIDGCCEASSNSDKNRPIKKFKKVSSH